jgi:predicted transcriptional regulator
MPLAPFSIRADAATMQALGRIATALDRSRHWVMNAALQSSVEDHAWLTTQVAASREEMAHGQRITHAQAMALLRQYITDWSSSCRLPWSGRRRRWPI